MNTSSHPPFPLHKPFVHQFSTQMTQLYIAQAIEEKKTSEEIIEELSKMITVWSMGMQSLAISRGLHPEAAHGALCTALDAINSTLAQVPDTLVNLNDLASSPGLTSINKYAASHARYLESTPSPHVSIPIKRLITESLSIYEQKFSHVFSGGTLSSEFYDPQLAAAGWNLYQQEGLFGLASQFNSLVQTNPFAGHYADGARLLTAAICVQLSQQNPAPPDSQTKAIDSPHPTEPSLKSPETLRPLLSPDLRAALHSIQTPVLPRLENTYLLIQTNLATALCALTHQLIQKSPPDTPSERIVPTDLATIIHNLAHTAPTEPLRNQASFLSWHLSPQSVDAHSSVEFSWFSSGSMDRALCNLLSARSSPILEPYALRAFNELYRIAKDTGAPLNDLPNELINAYSENPSEPWLSIIRSALPKNFDTSTTIHTHHVLEFLHPVIENSTVSHLTEMAEYLCGVGMSHFSSFAASTERMAIEQELQLSGSTRTPSNETTPSPTRKVRI